MSLKPCKECGAQVSTKADNCPNCGAPILAGKKVGPVSGCLIVIGLLFWVAVMVMLFK